MERVSWSYELPPAGAPDVGLEQYQVYAPGGEAWKATGLIRHGDDVYVAAAPSGFAVRRHLVAVPWAAVERVDHDALAIHLATLAGAVELDPERAVENAPADAPRVTELPPQLRRPQPTGDVAGPRDRGRLFLSLGAAAAGFVSLLVVIALLTIVEEGWAAALLAVPVVFFVVAGVSALLAWRRPYAPAAGPDAEPGARRS